MIHDKTKTNEGAYTPPRAVDMLATGADDVEVFKGLTATFSTSLRRGSPFNVEVMTWFVVVACCALYLFLL